MRMCRRFSGDLIGGREAPHSEASTECSFCGSAKLADLAKSCRDDYQGKIKYMHCTLLICTILVLDVLLFAQ